MKISDLSVDSVSVSPGNHRTMTVDLDGVSGDDFVACAPDDLIAEILTAVGQDRVVEHFDLELAEES